MVHGSSGRSRGGLEGGGGAAEGLEHGVPVAEVFGDDLHEGGAHDDACGARFERAPDVSGRGDAEAEQGGRGLGPLEVADDALCGRARGVPEAWSVPVMPTRESR